MELHDLDLTPIKELSDELMQDERLSIADKKEMLWNYSVVESYYQTVKDEWGTKDTLDEWGVSEIDSSIDLFPTTNPNDTLDGGDRDFCPGCDEVVIPPCASCENVRLNKVVNRLADMVNIYRDMVTDYRRMRGECELCFMTREEIIQDVAESIDD